MAHNKQAAKRNRQNIQNRAANKKARSAMKGAVRRVAVGESVDTAKAALPMAMKRIDKAAKAGVIHKNAAARLKSRMAKKLAASAAK